MLYDHSYEGVELQQDLSDPSEETRVTCTSAQTTPGEAWETLRGLARTKRPSMFPWKPSFPIRGKTKREHQRRHPIRPHQPSKLLPPCGLILVHKTL